MTSLTLTVASFLSLVILVHGDCVLDPSIPCECTNPFEGTDNFFLGNPERNCKAAKACYVKNLSGCADARQSRGGGRCQSKEACKHEQTTVEPTSSSETTSSSEATSSEATSTEASSSSEATSSQSTSDPTVVEPVSSESTSSEPTVVEPVTSESTVVEPIATGGTAILPLQPKCPGDQACICITASEVCEICDVECQADCNDLTTDGIKCFSELACNPNLLFEIENGLECPAPGSSTEGAVVEPKVVEAASPKPKCPAEEIGGNQICECLVSSPECDKCEVDCKSDCNDVSKEDGKCFSELACQDLLFEEDCEP